LARDGAVELLTDVLTVREREVLQLIAEGRTVKEVADALKVSAKTIDTHRANLYAKLRVSNPVELARIAIREGLAKG
jgi:DNA-binding NarL/FixJ family response regulator